MRGFHGGTELIARLEGTVERILRIRGELGANGDEDATAVATQMPSTPAAAPQLCINSRSRE